MLNRRGHRKKIILLLTVVLWALVDGRPQSITIQKDSSPSSTCTIDGKSGRFVPKPECWRCVVLPTDVDKENVDLRLDPENNAGGAKFLGADVGDVINLRETNVGELTCLSSEPLNDDDYIVCCPEDEIKEQCSKTGSRCVQQSVCGADDQPTCASTDYASGEDKQTIRQDYDTYEENYTYEDEEPCPCNPPQSVQTLMEAKGLKENFVCCSNVVTPAVEICEDGFKMVLESQCAFSTRLDIASDKDAGLLDLRQTEKEVCCPLRDVKSCDPDGFRMVPESECSVRIRLDAPFIDDGEEHINVRKEKLDGAIINLRSDRSIDDICCAIEDIIGYEEPTCDEKVGHKCVPLSQCSNTGIAVSTCAVDLRSVDLRQDTDDDEAEEEIVCCAVESIKSQTCEKGYSCVPSVKCNEASENVDLRGDKGSVDLRQDYEESQPSCVVPDDEQDGNFIRIDERQSSDYDYEENFVCCKEQNVVTQTQCPDHPGHICVPSVQCGGESVDLRQEYENATNSCGFFIRSDKDDVDLREDVNVRQSTDYYTEYDDYDYAEGDKDYICCKKEDYIEPVDDCSNLEDNVCILASQCDKESSISCNGNIGGSESQIRKGFSAVDLRVDEDYMCCSKKDVIPEEPLECYDIANHDCVDPSECLSNNVDLRSTEVDLRSDSEPVTGFCEKIEIQQLSSVSRSGVLALDPRFGGEIELICCDEKNIASRVEEPEKPTLKCRNFPGHRCVKPGLCKNPKVVGDNLEPSDAIDIRESSIPEEDSTENFLCQKEKVCCEELDIERPTPPPPKPTPTPPPKNPEPSTQLPVDPTITPELPFDIPAIVPTDKWPNMCGLYYKRENAYEYLSGASLITPGVVITTAHWVMSYKFYPQYLRVRCGSTNIQFTAEDEKTAPKVVSISIHPSFNEINLYNDVALLHLSSEFDMSLSSIGLISLPSKNKKSHRDKNCIATGWGRRGFDRPFSDVLKQIKLPLMQHDQCEFTFINKTRLGHKDQPTFKLHKSFVCAGGKHGEDTCRGDGGGPLMCPVTRNPKTYKDYEQVGVTSWGVGCGQSGVAGVYASTYSSLCFIDWAIKCKENTTYEEYINVKECGAGGRVWIDKHIKKIESHLKYVQRKPKALGAYGIEEIKSIKQSLSDQLESSLDLKQECGKGINRDAIDDSIGNRVDNAALTRNAQFGVVQSQFRR